MEEIGWNRPSGACILNWCHFLKSLESSVSKRAAMPPDAMSHSRPAGPGGLWLSFRKGLMAVLTAALIFSVALPPSAADAATKKKSSSSYNPRYAAIVIDADTGEVLHERYADKVLHPASLVKMMTLLMAFEALNNGTLTLRDRVRFSSHAAAQVPSKLGVSAGNSISVEEAILALVTKSANDVAVALGERIGGSEGRFVALMNQKAKAIGMSRSHFTNASGLHNVNQVSSARDMAILGRHLVMNYPRQYRYFSTKNFKFRGASHHNHNRLMETYKGMDGIKTGYIQPSGFNLAASAVRGDRRLIAVVFGGRTAQSRNNHVAELLDQGFAKLGIGSSAATTVAMNAVKSAPAAPLPDRKPGAAAAIPAQPQVLAATTSAISGVAAGRAAAPVTPPTRPAALEGGAIGEMIGEGDIDPAVEGRFETGMMAIAAMKTELRQPGATSPAVPDGAANTQAAIDAQNSSFTRFPITDNQWAIQLGAFTSRVKSDQALAESVRRLPADMRAKAQPVIVPLKAGENWVFRARLKGLTRQEAYAACKYFSNCMTISPRAF